MRQDTAPVHHGYSAAAEVEVAEVAVVSVVVGENRDEHRVERNVQTKKTGCVDKADDASDRMNGVRVSRRV